MLTSDVNIQHFLLVKTGFGEGKSVDRFGGKTGKKDKKT
jgi:hypothetical protein